MLKAEPTTPSNNPLDILINVVLILAQSIANLSNMLSISGNSTNSSAVFSSTHFCASGMKSVTVLARSPMVLPTSGKIKNVTVNIILATRIMLSKILTGRLILLTNRFFVLPF